MLIKRTNYKTYVSIIIIATYAMFRNLSLILNETLFEDNKLCNENEIPIPNAPYFQAVVLQLAKH